MHGTSPISGGPSHTLLARVGMARGDGRGVARAAAIVGLVTWVPLLVLSFMSGTMAGDTSATVPFLRDIAAHARLLVAIPLLLVAELVVGPRLGLVVQQLVDGCIVARDDPQFADALETLKRKRDSVVADLIGLAIAYVWSWSAVHIMAADGPATWMARIVDGRVAIEMAGWWYAGVSLPVFLFLMLRWFRRGYLWTRFLACVARLKLGLVATHPDRAGGIDFVGQGQTAFAIVAFALSSVLSASVAEDVLYAGGHVLDMKVLVIAFGILIVFLVFGPLLVFLRPLSQLRRRALEHYSRLLTAHNRAFEARWLDGRERAGDDLLGSSDGSSLADLGAAFKAIEEMTVVPITRSALIIVVLATALPFLPTIALEVPLREILKSLIGVLA